MQPTPMKFISQKPCPFGAKMQIRQPTLSCIFQPIAFPAHELWPRNLCRLHILNSFRRSLKCARITLHMNLFASFAANNSLWLIWYLLVMPDTELLHESPVSGHT